MNLLNAVTNRLGRSGLKLRKKSPEILLVAGIAAGVGTVVLACRATTKADAILEEAKDKLERIEQVKEDSKESEAIDYTDKDYAKNVWAVRLQTAAKLGKLYLPAAGLGLFSIGCVCKSHNIVHNRFIGATAAYTAISKSFNAYRDRVIEAEGESKDREYKYGITTEKVKTKIFDEESGKEKTKTITQVNVPSDMSAYGVWFSPDTTSQFDSSPGYNLAFLKGRETYWNQMLRVRGHVFLNEILHDLGFQHTSDGAIVGWIVDKNGDPIDGDGYIDFGIFDNSYFNSDEYNVMREGGRIPKGEIYLDFNVDGIIFDKI